MRTSPPEPLASTDDPLAAFIRRHQTGLWRFVRALGCPVHDADDLCQETLIIAMHRSLHLQADGPAAAAFLRRTGRHLWLRRARDDARRRARVAEAAELLWQRDCNADDGGLLLQSLAECVAALPERSRHVLDRFYRDRAGRAELARELELGEHGVRTLLQRVRKALKKCIERRQA